MHASPHARLAWLACAALALAGPSSAVQGKKKWDPLFDYTNLPPADEELWAPLAVVQVQMEDALAAARASEGEDVRPRKIALRSGPKGAAWHLELFVGGASGTPKRVNLQVSTAEPKVLKRLELLALATDEEQAWPVLAKSTVTLTEAIELAKKSAIGSGADAIVPHPRALSVDFVSVPTAPVWNFQIMGIDEKKELVRRYEIHVNADLPRVKRKLMEDRFSGEPLRGDKPVELPGGLFVHDFTVGDGQEVTAESKVRVNYRLFLLDSTKLHDTWETKLPETFTIGEAPLAGMRQGMLGMRAGGKRKIAMPYPLAFGEKGNEIAPPKAMVVCDIAIEELVGR